MARFKFTANEKHALSMIYTRAANRAKGMRHRHTTLTLNPKRRRSRRARR